MQTTFSLYWNWFVIHCIHMSVFLTSGSGMEPGCERVPRVHSVILISLFKSSTESAFQPSSYAQDVIILLQLKHTLSFLKRYTAQILQQRD